MMNVFRGMLRVRGVKSRSALRGTAAMLPATVGAEASACGEYVCRNAEIGVDSRLLGSTSDECDSVRRVSEASAV